jgi:multiple sugar transport system permease protein
MSQVTRMPRTRDLAVPTSYIAMTVLAIFFAVPLLIMVVGSLKPDDQVLVESGTLRAFWPAAVANNYGSAFIDENFGRLLLNSVIITGSVVVLGAFVNSMFGYALAWGRFRGRSLLLAAVVALFIVPFQVLALPILLMLANVGLYNTLIAQIIPFIANPFFIYMFYSFFSSLPRELEEAARLDGAGTFRIFWSIALPLSKPALATSAILTFIFIWGDLFWANMVTFDPNVRPVALGLSILQSVPKVQWGHVMATATLIAAPPFIFFLFFQRAFVRSIAQTGIKG